MKKLRKTDQCLRDPTPLKLLEGKVKGQNNDCAERLNGKYIPTLRTSTVIG